MMQKRRKRRQVIITKIIAIALLFTLLIGIHVFVGQYPKDLWKVCLTNKEMRDFILHYPEKKGNVYADKIDSVKEGEFPLLLQWDQR